MPNYNKAKIYKLWTPESDDIYIGSTCYYYLSSRLSLHKFYQDCRSKYLFENFNDVRIELLENYPCNNEKELKDKEAYYIKNNKCLNLQIPNRTHKEYLEENKEYFKLLKHKKYEKDKENLLKKVDCVCGSNVASMGMNRHLKTEKHCNFIKNNI
tara:strand:+ start:225 stop:689 length:465 start_codon:yes stop_codon:yes gene_type:complete